MPVYQLENDRPVIDPSVYIAPNASIIGKVVIGKKSSVWFNTVIRGDVDAISIGEETNVQDLTMLHVDAGEPLVIGNRVTIGHRCILHGCTVGDNCLIGMGATVMNGSRIGEGSVIAAGAVILENTEIPPFSLVAGIPGKIKRTFDPSVVETLNKPVDIYSARAMVYMDPEKMFPVED